MQQTVQEVGGEYTGTLFVLYISQICFKNYAAANAAAACYPKPAHNDVALEE
jgi:hypothetical protein